MDISAEMLGERAFSEATMRARLPKAVFKELKKTIDYGAPLDTSIADSVAIAMREWAKELGATHYTHWFHPLTNGTAEKHDSFMDPVGDGTFITEFTGKELIKAEPDGSSFPSGGLRDTCAARGYTVWDCTSPAFVKDIPDGCKVLCIPTIFISYTGESLDFKTPLLRSMDVVGEQALRILKLFGKTPVKVTATVGPEQEYFLVNKEKYEKRLDLKITGRTLFGAQPPKGQEMDDQYFAVVKDKVSHFMKELNRDLWAYGIPAKTQHNEGAPAQHEIAPIFGNSNIACDQNQILMDTLKRVAARTGFACLVHEKPFVGVNGSGKHNNWSLVTSDGEKLIDPGKENIENNLQFQIFLAAILAAVDDHAELLRLSASCPGNDHRLGAHEAPPAIISVYLGDQLDDIVKQIIENGEATTSLQRKMYRAGSLVIPTFKMDATDRNRTSPFAFTGNRFEFRMVGATQSISMPQFTINTIVASKLSDMADILEKSENFEEDAKKLVAEMLRKHQRIIFNGNGYSDEWVKEAERRGLPNIKRMVDAIPYLTTDKTVELFERFGVLNRRELEARAIVMYENYAKTINVEARTMLEMVNRQIMPVVMDYETKLAEGLVALKSLGVSGSAQSQIINDIDSRLGELKVAIKELETRLEKAEQYKNDPKAWAHYYCDEIFSYFDTVRKPVDELETMVGSDVWPLPTYEELLFEQ